MFYIALVLIAWRKALLMKVTLIIISVHGVNVYSVSVHAQYWRSRLL